MFSKYICFLFFFTKVEEEKQPAVPPKFDVRLVDKEIRIGEHIGELRAQVSGVPRPGVQWFKVSLLEICVHGFVFK